MKKFSSKRICVVIACLTVQLCVGILYLWSIFNQPLQEQFGLSASSANLVGSFMIFGFVLGNLVGGFLQDKLGPKPVSFIGCAAFCLGIFISAFLTPSTIWVIYITYSGLSGLGCGIAYGSILSCLQKWFPEKRGFASGLSVAAFGLSTVVFSPISQALLKHFSVSKVFLILSCVFFALTMLSCLFIHAPASAAENAPVKPSLTPKKTFLLPEFWCVALSCFFINATWNILVPIIKSLGIERGLSESAAGIAVMITGIANAVGRLGTASVSDKTGRTAPVIFMAALTAACAVALIWAKSGFYIVLIALVAMAYGGPSATFPAMTTDICGPKYSGTIYGVAMLGLGFSSVVFTAISNALKNATGDYTASFIMAAFTCVVPVVLMILYKYFVKKHAAAKASTQPEIND